MTGSIPGIAASTSETCELASPPNSVEAPENNLASELTWAWISMPITTSQPLMSLFFCAAASIAQPCFASSPVTRFARARQAPLPGQPDDDGFDQKLHFAAQNVKQ